MLQIEELDEWWTQKSRKPEKLKPNQDQFTDVPNHLKVGDKVLLDAADPRIAISEPNGVIPLTVLNIFPYGIVEPGTRVYLRPCSNHKRDIAVRYGRIMSSSRGKKTAIPASKKRKGAGSSSGPALEIRHPFLQVPLGPQEELYQILRDQPLGVGGCIDWAALEQIQLVDAVMENGHVLDLAYFIALAIHHQTERHRRGVISIGPYITRLVRHFGLLNTAAQSSSLTLIGQMSPQGISSMLIIKSSKAHHRIGTKNSTGKGSLQPPCPTRLQPLQVPDITFFWCRTYGLMNLYHHRSILLHPHHCFG
ncbi:hypothetical protein GOBAR_AA04055 [Gossypium barbadense]|uniref:Uncharacterized protein n=1 Tax=Gossypium barbadense TaxID=3634 RepID=A0A2P5YLP4_GOSBA|nr:hypothetical protein GOBAR_AA04055 [Gossypium barbadense]